MNPEWISVKDRLPEHGQQVWVVSNGESMFLGNAMPGMSNWSNGQFTHWMPAQPPEPPESQWKKAWKAFEKQWPESLSPREVFLAGYEAGRKG